MTKSQIATRLRILVEDMNEIAVAMDYYGGFSEWAQHGRELVGAASVASKWADKIDEEVKRNYGEVC